MKNNFNYVEILTEVTAFHGSAYDFDKFDVAYIGKGEHGQAHGWGLYFSLGQDTAQLYRSRISSMNSGYQFQAFTYNGKSYKSGTVMYSFLNTLANYGKKEAINKIDLILQDKDYLSQKENVKEYLEKIKKEFKKIKNGDLKGQIIYEEGNFYTVKLPELQYYIEEEKSFSEQSKYVQDVLKKILKENPTYFFIKDYMNKPHYYARGFYNTMSDRLGSPKAASLKLSEYGIVGIHYEGNIDKGCVVIFKNDDIKLLCKATNIEKDELELPQKMMIEEDPTRIQEVENPSKELQMIAVKGNPDVIKFIKNPDREAIEFAISNNVYLLPAINNIPEDIAEKYIGRLDGSSFANFIRKNIERKDFCKKLIIKNIEEDLYGYGTLLNYFPTIDDDIFVYITKWIKENFESEKLSETLRQVDRRLSEDKVKFLQDEFYKAKPYSELSESEREINYCVTSKYILDETINDVKDKTVFNRCLTWNWDQYLPELKEFTKEVLDIFKTNYKLGYLEYSHWTNFELNRECTIDRKVLDELLDFINELGRNDITIDISDLYKFMNVNELVELVQNNSTLFRFIYQKLGNESSVLNKEFVVSCIELLTMREVFEKNYLFNEICKNAYFILRSLYETKDNIITNPVYQCAAIKSFYSSRDNKDVREILNNASFEVQKFAMSIEVSLAKYISKLDDKIQFALIKKNPYNIKLINNPSPSVVRKASESIPNIDDYLR